MADLEQNVRNIIDVVGEDIAGLDYATQTYGKLIDGYIKGATLFADANGDGVWNEGEFKTTTDEFGNYQLPLGTPGTLIASGGTDIATGKAFQGVLKAPEGSGVITPLTTLLHSFMQQTGLDAASAQAQLQQALGLSDERDWFSLDLIAMIMGADSSLSEQQAALQAQIAAIQLQTLLDMGSALLQGLGIGTDAQSGQTALWVALVNLLANGESMNLTNPTQLGNLLGDAAAQAGASPAQLNQLNALAQNAGQALANLNGHLADQANASNPQQGLIGIAQAQFVIAGLTDSMQSGASNGNLLGLLDQTQGSA